MVQVDSMFSGPAFPGGFHARCGIDKGAIHVEEDCLAAEVNQKIKLRLLQLLRVRMVMLIAMERRSVQLGQ